MSDPTLAALLALRQQVEDTIMVAKTDEDAEGWICAYHFQTGAIHRLLAKAREPLPGAPASPPPAATASAAPPDDGPDEGDTVCTGCGETYDLRDGEDPTDLCDHCAHEAVAALRAERDAQAQRIAYLEGEETKIAAALRLDGWRGVTCGPDEAILSLIKRLKESEAEVARLTAERDEALERLAHSTSDETVRSMHAESIRVVTEGAAERDSARAALSALRERIEALATLALTVCRQIEPKRWTRETSLLEASARDARALASVEKP